MIERILKAVMTQEHLDHLDAIHKTKEEIDGPAKEFGVTPPDDARLKQLEMDFMKTKVVEALTTFGQKRSEYGDTDKVVVDALTALYPNGIPPERFYEATFAMKIIEKLSRLSSEKLSPERLRDAYKDVVGYGLLGVEEYTDK